MMTPDGFGDWSVHFWLSKYFGQKSKVLYQQLQKQTTGLPEEERMCLLYDLGEIDSPI